MNTFRRFSRRAWLLHGYLLASMILWPVPTVRSYWTWDAGTGAKVEITDPPVGDSWWDEDSDGDGMTNAQEVVFGSDPYSSDSDYDGLSDADERDLTAGMHGGMSPSDPWSWDSNNDGYSDHDTYWAWVSGTALEVHYSSLTPPSPLHTSYYYDADGDGHPNHQDAYPLDGTQWDSPPPEPVDTDGDGHADDQDSHPDDNTQWDNWPVDNDSDDDGHDDDQDSHPDDSTQWDNWPPDNDADDDGYDDDQDSHPYDPSQWDNWPVDTDGDGWPDDNDSHPDDVGRWSDGDGNGYNDDDTNNQDMDAAPDGTDSHPQDSSLWDDRDGNGTNDFEEEPVDDDADDDGVTDSDESTSGTDPLNPDSDGDGLLDGEEHTATTSPLDVDTDADGLTDYEEIMVYHTNPRAPRTLAGQGPVDYYQVNRTDADQDGLPDLIEAHYGLSSSNPADAYLDQDNDGFTNLEAYNFGWHLGRGFRSYDYDADGITDAREAYWDAMYSGIFSTSDRADATADYDADGVLNIEELRLGLDPGNPSTLGMPDLDYANQNGFPGWTICRRPGQPGTDADNDTDGDGMSDVWEHLHRFDLRDARDAIRDPDRDGLSNLTEYRFQSHPRIPKSNRTTHDRTRLYATGSPLNASTTSGLMNRYRAKMAADLGGSSSYVSYPVRGQLNQPGPGGNPVIPATVTATVLEENFWTSNDAPAGSNVSSQRLDFNMVSHDSSHNNHPCGGPKPCDHCNGTGWLDCARCEGGTMNCPGGHTTPCEKKILSACPGHDHVPCPGGHDIVCEIDHYDVDFGLTCTDPDCEHEELSCYGFIDVPVDHSEAGCNNGQPCEGGCGAMVPVQCPGTSCPLRVEEDCPSCGGYGEIPRACDSTCTRPPCDNPECDSGEVPCPYCSDGEVCECDVSGCTCYGSDGECCPRYRIAGTYSVVSGTADIQYNDENDTTAYVVKKDGEIIGVLGPASNSRTVGLPTLRRGETAMITLEAIEEPNNPSELLNPKGNVQDSAGPRHRKIGLNGLPLSDSKPQVQDESGEIPEETYIDAYTRQLKHSVTDVYSTSAGLLPLQARRDVAGKTWSKASQIFAGGRTPLEPFGPGWSSNLCAYIQKDTLVFTMPPGPPSNVNGFLIAQAAAAGAQLVQGSDTQYKAARATVVDEQGTSQNFVATETPGIWLHTMEEGWDARTMFNTFDGAILTKKFGTTCFYEESGIGGTITVSQDENGFVTVRKEVSFKRLLEVRDRQGNRLRYTYDGTGTLIPSMIHDPDRPGHFLRITQNNGRITAIQGPDGSLVDYHYDAAGKLEEVERAGSTVGYEYEHLVEHTEGSVTHHLNLFAITDELGRRHVFHRVFDTDRVFDAVVNPGTKSKGGNPRVISHVSGPGGMISIAGHWSAADGSTVRFNEYYLHHPDGGVRTVNVMTAHRECTALDGSVTRYRFDNPVVREPNGLDYQGMPLIKTGAAVTVTFSTLTVERSKDGVSHGQEVYTFNPAAGFAVATATDLSGNRIEFDYGSGTRLFDDPLTETRYLGSGGTNGTPVMKHFTYDPDTRIMTSMTDPMGVRTEYTIDNSRTITRDGMTIPIRGLKTAEKVFDAQNNLLRETRYSYDHPIFAGLVTKQWTISPNEEAMPSSVTTTTLGDPGSPGFSGGWCEDASRAWILSDQDSTTPSYRCGWWREVTTTTGPATGSGALAAALSVTETISDLGGKKRQVIDARGFDTTFDYDDSGRLTRVEHPDESFKTLDYDAHGNLTSETNENGVTTFHRYDPLNRRIKTAIDLNGNGQPDWDAEDHGPGDRSYTLTGSTPGTMADPPAYDGDLVTTTFYNSRNQITAQVDARGLLTSHAYDDAGRLESTITGAKTTLFYYDGLNNGGSVFDTSTIKPNRTVDPRGVVTTVVYDSLYRPVSSTVSDPGLEGGPMFTAVTLTEYDLNGKPTKVTDPLERVTLNEYDDLGNLIQVTEPDLTTDTSDNPTVQSYYTHHGKPWKVIDQMGNVTTTRYDALGRPVEVKGPPLTVSSSPSLQVSAITTTEYDAAGNAIAVTDPLGRVVETLYDERNRPTHVYAPTMWDAVSGQFVRPYAETTYDALGQPLSVTDHTGATTTNHYDPAGRKWKVEAPALLTSNVSPPATVRPTTLTYFDPGGLPVTVTNPLGQTITNTYNIHGQLIQTVDAEGILNEFDYDAAGNRTSVKDGLNQETTFAYDGLNRLIRQTFANGDTWTHTYNAVQKESQLSPRGILTSYTYDARDRLLTVATSGTEGGIAFPPTSRSYTYDNAGKLLTVTESGTGLQPVLPGSALAVSYTYDEMGRVTAECSNNQTHQYEYDLAGNRVKATYSTGRVVETSYDGLNRPEAIVDGDRLTRYGYDKAGRAVILVAANGQTSSNTYDALGRLTDRVLYKTPAMDPAQRLAQFQWEHDLLGNVTKQEEIWPGETTRAAGVRSTTMGYDDNNRLTSETISHPTEGTQSTTYTYDDANNRDTKTITGGTEPGHWDYTYNAANQLVSWTKRSAPAAPVTSILRSATLTYDDAGNRTSQTIQEQGTPNPEPRTTAYTWDAQDRLASVTLPDGSEHRYAYDYRTRRISTGVRTPSSANETKTSIVFSGGLSVAEWEQESGTGLQPVLSAPPTVEYTRGPDMGGGVGGLLYSKRGSSLKYNLSNGRGDIVAQADQYASLTWTASYEAYGKRTKETGTNLDKQRGNSKDEDPTGLLNEGFRYRDLETGVWLSRDPAGFVDGPNLYAYCTQNPWSHFDADGLFLSALMEKLDTHIFTPVGEAIGNAAGSMMSNDTLAGLSDSKAFNAAGSALNATKSASMTALNTLSPFDDAAKAALNGDIKGALTEAGKEVAGGKFTKVAGKALKAGGALVETMVKKGGDDVVASAQKNAGAAAEMVQKSAPAPAVYDVGKAKDLRATPLAGTEVNHVPGSASASTLVPTQNPANKFGNEAAIRLPQSEHAAVSAAQNALGAQASARDLLAQELKILRNNTNAPNSALQKASKMNKEAHPWDYKKTDKE